ncbi:3-hydroxyacyl-CoA dehydrogenase [Rhodospirillum rubrum]|uniref:3-hydroxyacyl-CoA dehydrogenase/enoyl-CoA hydratase family protein n=1 Tax=Rhodospirillum rubrum TaxID=1085 RepID=UPI001908D778|nr:3-hydroxyacyl-CoA dehydrogenase/enoyl-CoA hydratase family protein [Rhodospirillum rubrum]MBK1663001.1 3-hydroxyacyl-CoA dehydrogenase [Rhodospirillum rubrum]MBK1676014.1 3-hydroxyacyl-CoA dehydrogenase [Rhodospirillum rubrum]
MSEIAKVAVIGAGVMGAGIAAHVANAGLPVLLLDIVAKDSEDRSAIAAKAIERLQKSEPSAFMGKAAAKRVTPGNIEDDLDKLADCDWIVEAILERADLKQDLYRRVEAVRKDGSVVSSNTSTIPLSTLTEGLGDRFAEDFLVTHFFNPPRYMRLLEVVAGAQTKPEVVETISRFADHRLGKGVVACKDRPGFIANRLGVYWLQAAVAEAFDHALSIEEADAVIGRPMGIPKTGVFGLLDLVGLDLMPHVNASLAAALPKDDPFQAYNRPLAVVDKMIAEGYTGRKGKGGFYRITRAKGGKVKEAIDLHSGEWRPERKADPEAIRVAGRDLRALLDHDSPVGRYARAVLTRTLSYAALLVGDAADDPAAIDDAMRLGYNWKQGPFELIDRLGADWLAAALTAQGDPVPPYLAQAAGRKVYKVTEGHREILQPDGAYCSHLRPEGVLLLEDIKLVSKPLLKNGSAALWDIGDGVACFEFTSKMNALDPDILGLLAKSLKLVARQFKALVIYNEGGAFSAGANLGLALFAANIAAWSEIETLVAEGQKTYRALREAPFPVVGAPSGLALGGGCEILLHCDAVQAHAESYIGLVEVGVGLVPAWGGCTEMLHRWSTLGQLPKGPMPALSKVFETVSTATVAKSAAEAKELLFLREGDGITMNRDRLLADAKAKALALVEGYTPPPRREFTLPGPAAKTGLDMAVASVQRQGKATAYDGVVCGALADILSGGDTDITVTLTEDVLLELERTHFMALARRPETLARIETMLLTGKPLRN